MADQVKKFLAKLNRREFEVVQALLLDLANDEVAHLDIKPLKGHKDMYRVRKGRLRVIFLRQRRSIAIISIGFRDDQTYRDL